LIVSRRYREGRWEPPPADTGTSEGATSGIATPEVPLPIEGSPSAAKDSTLERGADDLSVRSDSGLASFLPLSRSETTREDVGTAAPPGPSPEKQLRDDESSRLSRRGSRRRGALLERQGPSVIDFDRLSSSSEEKLPPDRSAGEDSRARRSRPGRITTRASRLVEKQERSFSSPSTVEAQPTSALERLYADAKAITSFEHALTRMAVLRSDERREKRSADTRLAGLVESILGHNEQLLEGGSLPTGNKEDDETHVVADSSATSSTSTRLLEVAAVLASFLAQEASTSSRSLEDIGGTHLASWRHFLVSRLTKEVPSFRRILGVPTKLHTSLGLEGALEQLRVVADQTIRREALQRPAAIHATRNTLIANSWLRSAMEACSTLERFFDRELRDLSTRGGKIRRATDALRGFVSVNDPALP
ncbi:unnamed protein product, partial [Amoebophrya sp. A25]